MKAPLNLALILSLLVASPAAAQQSGQSLTLGDAIARALQNNEGILIERASLASADAAITGARGAYDPVLGVEGGWRSVSEPVSSAFSGAPAGRLAPRDEVFDAGAAIRKLLPTGGVASLSASAFRGTTDGAFDLLSPAYGTRLGAELRQPLLRDRAIDPARFQLRVAAADRERAAASLEREVLETVAAVERAYWTLAAARREIAVREQAVALAEEQLGETEIRIDNGVAPATEIAQPRAELERRRGELLASLEALARAENELKLLILGDADGGLWGERLTPADDAELAPDPVDVAAVMARALTARPELAAAEAALERRRVETALAVNRIKPALDLLVSYDRFGLAGSENPAGGTLPGLPGGIPRGLDGGLGRSFETLAEGDFDDARVALVFEVPIGNRTARAAAETARNGERQAEAVVAQLRKAVRAEVLDAAAALTAAGGRIDAARAAREAAEVQLAAERERYAVGLSTNFLVLTRQNDLSRARLDEIAARTDYRTAATEMARATGSLLEERGIAVVER